MEKWTKEKIIKIAQNYTNMKDFFENEHSAYVAAQKRKMLYNELNWLKRKKNSSNFWFLFHT